MSPVRMLDMGLDKIKALRQTDFFKDLAEAEIRALAERAAVQQLTAGQILFVAGEKARGMYVVVEGAVRAFRESVEGREQVIHIERSGATIAELPVFDDGPYPSTVAAEENSVLLFLHKEQVRRLCLEHPQIAWAGLRLLARRLRRAATLIESLSLHEVDERLARFILAESKIRGTTDEKGLSLTLKLTNQQIAARIGTVREVVSRALARLQQSGLIELSGRRIRIPDPEALESFAGQPLQGTLPEDRNRRG